MNGQKNIRIWNVFHFDTLKEQIEKLKNVPVYVTIDLDVLDPGVFPGTGTPEPGGITYRELLDAIMHLQQLQHMVAAVSVELSPRMTHLVLLRLLHAKQ